LKQAALNHPEPLDSSARNTNVLTLSPTRLIDLDEFEPTVNSPLDEILSTECLSSSETTVSDESSGEGLLDIWNFAPDADLKETVAKARTWEQFRNEVFKERQIYLSEAPPAIWDAVWTDSPNHNQDSSSSTNISVIQTLYILRGLFDLSLGLNSTLFMFDESGKACCRKKNLSMSGLTVELTNSLVQKFGSLGQDFRLIDAFVKDIYGDSDATPSRIAAADAVRRVAFFTKNIAAERALYVQSVLQLQTVFSRPTLILQKLRRLLNELRNLFIDQEIVNHVFAFSQKHESKDQWFLPITIHILKVVSGPSLDSMSHCMGLKVSRSKSHELEQTLHLLLATGNNAEFKTTLYHALPNLFLDEQKESVVHIAQSLKLLEEYKTSHVLNANNNSIAKPPKLEILFSWVDIERIQQKANNYESNIRAMLKGNSGILEAANSTLEDAVFDEHKTNPYGSNEKQIAQNISESLNLLNDMSSLTITSNDGLERSVSEVLFGHHQKQDHATLLPPVSILASESFTPIIAAQSRLVNFACLEMLFKDHNLLHHLDVQYEFQLLGSGIFSSRLSQALFSPDLSSAERKKGRHRMGVLGLRLGSRSTWPPASAELRLALMGILADCYHGSFQDSAIHGDELPGNLSFSIRNLSESEIEACTNPNSLQALDFLRLQYRPSKALGSIITESTLEKYDRIFRFLLRLNRVSFTVSNFWMQRRNETRASSKLVDRFNIEANHFLKCLALYSHSCISSTWASFRRILDSLNRRLDASNAIDSLGEHDGISQLSQLHESALDKILFDLLLKKRQEKVMDILEDILTHIIQSTVTDADGNFGAGIDLEDLFREFRKKTSLFIAVCRGLGDRGDYISNQAAGFGSAKFVQEWKSVMTNSEGLKSLPVMLDMNDWYGKQ
jgi:hypothetical protein